MRYPRVLVFALLTTLSVPLTGCNSGDDQPTGAEHGDGYSDIFKPPANDQGTAKGGTTTDGNVEGGTAGNTDSASSLPTIKSPNPCEVVPAAALNKIFETTFQPIGSTDPEVTDPDRQQRACGYSATSARVDVDESRYSLIDLTVIITTEVDPTSKGAWQGLKDFGGTSITIDGTNDALQLGEGHYAGLKNGIVFEVESPYSELNDASALKIMQIAAGNIR